MSKASDAALLAAHYAAEAASKPAVLASGTGTVLAGLGDWVSTGPGLATAIGLCLTLVSLILQMWWIARQDKRQQQRHEAEMKSLGLTKD